ncbi:hypothetical protein DCCM_3706 [Desulfocucumis palustris]|uniref:Uncharacterized protein n=1 Tax=Desulfocucumis palustris TaxID=1898651 RepID=A0A2L2XE11_9FIRM|nr:hypothetical protein [Desulfocucumis palustris]GBF34587.1 hypothetical protein DCCM_3706 [Desulfocucumis palustris]
MALLKVTDQLRIVTAKQLSARFWSNNMENGDKSLKKLGKKGYLLRHVLKNKNKTMVIYTLGPAGCKLLNKPYQPNWWARVELKEILKILVFNQLYLRIHHSMDSKALQAPYPLTSVIIINNREFPVLVVRGDIGEIAREVRWADLNRAMVICEEHEQIEKIALNINIPARFTTDYELCFKSLNEAFYSYNREADTVEKETVDIFG